MQETPTISTSFLASNMYAGAEFLQDFAIGGRTGVHPIMTFTTPEEAPVAEATNKRRLVKVVIIDPDENVPLEQSLLYSGEERFQR